MPEQPQYPPNLSILCAQFEAAYEAGLIHIRLSAPADHGTDAIFSSDPFSATPRLPVLRAERRKSGGPVFTIDRSLVA